jgi:predicted nucleotidyltransferase
MINEPVTIERIRDVAARIAAAFAPERIVLFGSHAEGRAGAGSDVDLLVVMKHSGPAWRQAAAIRAAAQADFPIYVLVRDPETLRRRIDQEDWFLRDVVARGLVLHEAADGRVAA